MFCSVFVCLCRLPRKPPLASVRREVFCFSPRFKATQAPPRFLPSAAEKPRGAPGRQNTPRRSANRRPKISGAQSFLRPARFPEKTLPRGHPCRDDTRVGARKGVFVFVAVSAPALSVPSLSVSSLKQMLHNILCHFKVFLLFVPYLVVKNSIANTGALVNAGAFCRKRAFFALFDGFSACFTPFFAVPSCALANRRRVGFDCK